MVNRINISNIIIYFLDELRRLLASPDIKQYDSRLERELVDKFIDKDIQAFLVSIGQTTLAELISEINSDNMIAKCYSLSMFLINRCS